mmetsp:Transcript_13833/g.20952  ORF Transcript_13833/g.20952 Transcript_13833/m.20952 type:complete len:305 (+) Transcript_13833:60-974(+)
MLNINFKKVENGVLKQSPIKTSNTIHSPVLSPLSPSKRRGIDKPNFSKALDMRSMIKTNKPSMVLAPLVSKKKSKKRKKKKKKKNQLQLFKDVLRQTTINDRFLFQLCRDPLEYQKTDVLVCPTHSSRLHLHESDLGKQLVHRGGFSIQRECDEWVDTYGPLSNESVAISTGGHLRSRYIVFPKLPIFFGSSSNSNDDKKLLRAIYFSLLACHKLLATSVVLPLFSMSTFDFPMARSICLLYHAILLFFSNFPTTTLTLVRITTSNNQNHQHLLELEHVRRFGKSKSFMMSSSFSPSHPLTDQT